MNPLLLALFGLSLALSISGVELIGNLLFLIGLWPFVRSPGRFPWTKSPFDIPILIYVLWILICASVAGSMDPLSVLRKQGAFLLFFLIAQAFKAEDIKKVMVWFLIGSAVAGLLGIIQVMVGHPEGLIRILCTRDGRSVGTRSHPLTYGETFIPGVLFLLGLLGQKLFIEKKSMSSAWKEGAAVALMAAGILFSQSRGVWVGLFFGFSILLSSWPKKYAWTAAGLIFGSVLVVFLASPKLRQRAYSITNSSTSGVSDLQSNATRFQLWKQSSENIQRHPLMGVGLSGAKLKTVDPATGLDRTWSEAHNIYLQTAIESGLVGLGIFLWLVWILARSISELSLPWRPICYSILLAFLVAGLTESWTGDKEIALIFWTFAGIVQSLRKGNARPIA